MKMKNDNELREMMKEWSMLTSSIFHELLCRTENNSKEFFTLQEAAEYLNRPTSYMYALLNNGCIAKCQPRISGSEPEKRSTARVYFLKKDLDEFITKSRIPAKNAKGKERKDEKDS